MGVEHLVTTLAPIGAARIVQKRVTDGDDDDDDDVAAISEVH